VQLYAHVREPQSQPVKPAAHTHLLCTHEPCPLAAWHLSGQARWEHDAPVYPLSHEHVPLKHLPCPEQSFGHERCEQS